MSRFPKRVYTEDEVDKARRLVESGYKHRLAVRGNTHFKQQTRAALKHIKTAGHYDFLRTYIKRIVEIDGFSQLREAEASIWANTQLLENPIEAASFFVQKAWQMEKFLKGKPYYGGTAEAKSVEKRIAFLKALKSKSRNLAVKAECERMLKNWAESTFVF